MSDEADGRGAGGAVVEDAAAPAPATASLSSSSASSSTPSLNPADGATAPFAAAAVAENGDSSSRMSDLYAKYTERESEMERLEQQNEEYRERLLTVMRERDRADELLKCARGERTARIDELERKVLEQESQLKVAKDRATAQEAHYSNTTRDLTNKFNQQVAQLTKKMEQAETEKNQSVVKYAMREAELMNIKAEMLKKDAEIKGLKSEVEQLLESTGQERLDQLNKTNEDLRVELEKVKHERFDLENRLKLSEKRADVGQSALSELRQQVDVLRRQLIQMKEDKSTLQDENKALVARVQSEEQRVRQEEQRLEQEHQGKEELYIKIVRDAARAKELNVQQACEIQALAKEKSEFGEKLTALEERLRVESERAEGMQNRLEELGGIEAQVKSSLDEKIAALAAKEEAESERDNAEAEADQCRKQAERMLEITETLTSRNSTLATELDEQRQKLNTLQDRLLAAEGTATRADASRVHHEQELAALRVTTDAEIASLRAELRERISKVQELTSALNEERNDAAAAKKRSTAAIKELKQEVSALRRQLAAVTAGSGSLDAAPQSPAGPSSTLASSSSRTSSITSVDQIGRRDEPTPPASACPADEPSRLNVQQVMVDKIVKLQKQLQRRNEKIEFLDEHVCQCLDELQKKTKIIQHYALREEASLLLPSDGAMEKLMNCCQVVQVPISKKTQSAYALMGAMFTGGDKKTSMQLATEVNSRLQAVLEETLIKNISLKTNVDTLGEEVARLSRENRQLALSNSKS